MLHVHRAVPLGTEAAAAAALPCPSGQRKAKDLWMWLATLPDANGRTHGLSSGSLETFKERSSKSLRPTARR
jgi:hypothetical protein